MTRADEVRHLLNMFSDTVVRKAEKLVADTAKITKDEHEGWWTVKGSGGSGYRVQVMHLGEDGYAVTCTCPNGSHLGARARCYHAAAALLMTEQDLADHQDEVIINLEGFDPDDPMYADLRSNDGLD